MNTIAKAAESQNELAKIKADKSDAEPNYDCISYNFKGCCNRLTALYCKTEKCSFYMTHDDVFAKKRAALDTASTTPKPNTKASKILTHEGEKMQALENALENAIKNETVSIAKQFTPDEWDAIIALIPTNRLGEELINRATKGEKKLKRMQAAWNEEEEVKNAARNQKN